MTALATAISSALLPLPTPRGPLTDHLLGHLTGIVPDLPPAPTRLALDDADGQQALWLLNAAQVGDHPAVVAAALRSIEVRTLHWQLEASFESGILETVRPARVDALAPHLDELLTRTGIDVAASAALAGAGAVQDVFLAKAPYLGFEADPHTFALATLEPAVQNVMAEIQAGEYGVGHDRTHSEIYRSCLDALGVSYGDAVDAAPVASFVDANLAWLFGRDRRWRGASVGQLCFLELDSVEPCGRHIDAWDGAGLPRVARRWYDVHVLADQEHEAIVRRRLVPAIERHTPWLVDDAAFGAEATWFVQQRVALELTARWPSDRTAPRGTA